MLVYQYETGEGTVVFNSLDDLMEELRAEIDANSLPSIEIDLHIKVGEMTEDEYDALSISDEFQEDLDTIYEVKDSEDRREFLGTHRGASWTRDYAGVGGYRITLYERIGDQACCHKHGTSAQMDKADDICRFWVTEGRVSASFVKAREDHAR